jgi:type IV pilus assembly protein PilY1
MKTNTTLSWLGACALLLAGAAHAGPTAIAQLPLIDVKGTGVIKPNLMIMYDNSGSMQSNFTPDYVDDSTSCRRYAFMVADPNKPGDLNGRGNGNVAQTTGCRTGRAPFNSSDFNRQYYNPALRYLPPVYADGTSYPSQNRTTTTGWTLVTTDGFGVNKSNMRNNTETKTNLVTGFPDLKFCDGGGDCRQNTATYTYPNNVYSKAEDIKGNPFYYTIKTAEYCTDDKLTNCIGTAVNAPAPAGYPYPAKLRWCTDPNLDTNTCRAKFEVNSYKYPRFSNPGGGIVAAYGTITVDTTADKSRVRLDEVTVREGSTSVVINSDSVSAKKGITSLKRQAEFATELAYKIIEKTGLSNQYTACVRDPAGDYSSGVQTCDSFGITLATDNVVAVIPLDCPRADSAKADCSVLNDDTRAGWPITVSGTAPVTADALSAGDAVFVRTDIVAGRNSYPKTIGRTDCAGSSCTYDEEMTNFANWYAYYKTRNQMMKSAIGLAFKTLTGRYRVGLATLSEAAASKPMTQLPAEFAGTPRSDWYTALYAMDGDGITPTRKAMHAIGEMFANKGKYEFEGDARVVQYPCQQNFMIITTDGYWNGGNVPEVASSDEKEDAARFCTAKDGCVDKRKQDMSSLADIALYWYNGGSDVSTVSLRPDLEPNMAEQGQVPARPGENTHLHVNTYTLGLGVDGMMTYEKDYDTAPKAGGDFSNVINGVTKGCPWNNNAEYVWPDPQVGKSDTSTVQARVDDLWHAAVNGRGRYFAASDPEDVVTGLSKALTAMEVRTGAAAAAATSTPNISQADNDLFADTFTTVQWWGELASKKVSIVDGKVSTDSTWTTTDTLGKRVQDNADSRKIYMAGEGGLGLLRDFVYSDSWEVLLRGWFSNLCMTQMSQCLNLTDAEKQVVNNGATIVNWLRGQQAYANDRVLRAYTKTKQPPYKEAGVPIILGDIVSSKPTFVREPRKAYSFGSYNSFKVAQAGRSPTIYVAANDGMLHAFDGNGTTGGAERWAYVPRITMKKLARQASLNYATNHQFTADGSPETADVQIDGAWRTVLVAGLNGGGRGYYALDVTNPAAPVALWELCADPAICTRNDPDLGLTFGNPQFGMWNDKWVVFLTSGYNNVPGTDGVNLGDGIGYLYIVDVATGEVLSKTATGAGSLTTPSGFAKITAISPNPFADPVITYVYGGDNEGHMWRFDLTEKGKVKKSMMGDAGSTQPITTRPEVTSCKSTVTDAAGNSSVTAKTVVVYGTGRMLHLDDLTMTAKQSVYVLRDSPDEALPWREAPNMEKQTLSVISPANAPVVYSISGADVDFATKSGWYVDFDMNTGERVTLDPKTASGTLVVVTNVPKKSDDCNVGGKALLYQLDVCTGNYLQNDAVAGEVLLNDAAAVGSIIVRLPSGALKLITTSAKGEHNTHALKEVTATEAHKVGWRRVRD